MPFDPPPRTQPPDVSANEELLAECVEEVRKRAMSGEALQLEAYRRPLGPLFEEFTHILRNELELDVSPSSPFPRPFGSYTLLEKLGEGAAGIVYRAHHDRLDRDVAIKVLRGALDESARIRFIGEGRTCASIRHPNVVDVYEAGEVDGQPYYAMELLEGETLQALIAERSTTDHAAWCQQFASLARTLHDIHRAGVVHRDIKPSNLMVRGDGTLVLADFGLARSAEAEGLTRSGEIIGTPLYMSPEQVLGQRGGVDARSDVYGLGATMFETFAGRPPLRAEGIGALLRAILKERPSSPSTFQETITPDLDRILLKCIEKDPRDRYETASALADDLERFVEGQSVQGRPTSSLTRALRVTSRYAVPISMAGALLLGSIAWFVLKTKYSEITVRSVADAEASINGSSYESVPRTLRVRRGAPVVISLRAPRFLPAKLQQDVDQEHVVIRDCLSPAPLATPDDFRRFQVCRGTLSYDTLPLENERLEVDPRLGPGEYALPIYPRGAVRNEDASTGRISFGGDYVDSTTVQFWIKGAQVASVNLKKATAHFALPREVLDILKPGMKVTWGVGSDEVKFTPHASFHVVAPLPARVRESLTRELAGQPENVVAFFTAQALARNGLETAAFLTLEKARATGHVSIGGLLLQARLLEDLVERFGSMESTRLWTDIRSSYSALTRDGKRDADDPPR